MKLYLTALGCRLNEAEIEAMARAATAAGHEVVSDPALADWALINTCTVTHVAARKSRQAIRRLHRKAPTARLAVAGCYGSMDAGEAISLPGVELLVPNTDKDRALDLLLAHEASPAPAASGERRLARGRTRAFIKVQDGCDNRCTYCIVRIARGASRSCPYDEVLQDIQARVAEGANEVVLSGVNIGAYGRDLASDEPTTLAALVERLLADSAVPRLRLSSLEPWDLDDALLALWPNPRLCRQLHLPLQSGSDAVLRRMARPMSADAYRALAERVRSRVPQMSLSTDLIVGFPGETDADFEATCALVGDVSFARLHVFRYSVRPGTPAAEMPDQVAEGVAQERARRLIELGHAGARAFHRRFVGTTVTVLFESPAERHGQAGWVGLTDNYLRVWAPSASDLRNRLADVRCERADGNGLEGPLTAP